MQNTQTSQTLSGWHESVTARAVVVIAIDYSKESYYRSEAHDFSITCLSVQRDPILSSA